MEKWFDPQVYMANKLVQMQETDPTYTMTNLVDAFAAAGFVGEEGYYAHFVQYGANEDVAPNAFFNAQEYYTAKAAQFYGEAFDGSELLVAQVKALIQQAGMNAWTHYQQYGSAEGVDPSNAFDASAYCAAKAEAMNAAGLKDAAGNDWTADSIKTAIDQAGMSVLEHYLTYAGTGEGEVAAGSTYPVSDDDQVVVPNPGVNIVVTNGGTSYNGTAGDDGFYVMQGSVLQAYHTLDGGEGNDTLFLGDQPLNGATIRNIENLVVTGGDELTGAYDMNLFATSFTLNGGTGVVENVTSQKLVANGATKLTVAMAADQTSVDLTSQNRANQQSLVLHGDSLSSVKLAVDEAAQKVHFTGSDAKVTDLAITAAVSDAEDDVAEVDVQALTELANVTVAGAGAVKLDVVAANDELKAVDATANTGGVEVDLSAAPAKAVFKGGAGDDYLKLDESTAAAHTLGAGDDTVEITTAPTSNDFSVDGGEGTDTLMMTADVAAKFTIGDVVKNFEILKLSGSTAAATVDMDDFGDINHVVVAGTLNAALTVNNVDTDGTIEFTAAPGANGVTVAVTDAGEEGHDTDVLNVTIADAGLLNAGTLNVDDVETIHITADDTDLTADGTAAEHTMTLAATAADKAADTVTISGDAGLKLTLTNYDDVKIIDASANTGGVDLTGTDLGTSTTFKGGAGDDDISVAVLANVPATANAVLTFDGFEAGDTIKMGDVSGELTKLTVNSTDNWASVVDQIDDSANVWFQFGGNTYVAVSGTRGFGVGDDDYIVKLSGLVDLTDATVTSGVLELPEGA